MVQEKSDFPSVDLLGFACSDDGAPPQGHMPIFSEVHTREDPVLDTTPLNHTYRLHFLISDSYSIFESLLLESARALRANREDPPWTQNL